MATRKFEQAKRDDNPDPITGAPGSHPVETGVGAAAGGLATGALVGAAGGGPIGAAVGAAVGGIVGGLAGKEVGEQIDPTSEDAYWREHYRERDYVEPNAAYDTYQGAYRYGWETRDRYAGRTFEDVEPELGRNWSHAKSQLAWDKAKRATRDAWERIDRSRTGEDGV